MKVLGEHGGCGDWFGAGLPGEGDVHLPWVGGGHGGCKKGCFVSDSFEC